MGDECTDCGIEIEPKVDGEKVDTTMDPGLPITKIEEIDSTSVAEVPAEVVAEEKREEIPKDAEMTRIIKIEGAETLEKTLDALRDLVEEAKKAIEKE
jgi:hypothetical protein